MIAFHGSSEIKEKCIQRLLHHQKMEQIIQGTGWDEAEQSGCNVGCILHKYKHAAYETELGLPEWYARLCDTIFEGLPRKKAAAFAVSTLTAVPVGVSIELVRWQLAIARHSRDLAQLADNNEPYAEECRKAIQGVIDYCEKELKGFYKEAAAGAAAARRGRRG